MKIKYILGMCIVLLLIGCTTKLNVDEPIKDNITYDTEFATTVTSEGTIPVCYVNLVIEDAETNIAVPVRLEPEPCDSEYWNNIINISHDDGTGNKVIIKSYEMGLMNE